MFKKIMADYSEIHKIYKQGIDPFMLKRIQCAVCSVCRCGEIVACE